MFIFSITSLKRLLGRELIPSAYHPHQGNFLWLRVVCRQASAEQKTKQTLVIRMADLRQALAVGPSHFGDPTSSPGQ